MKRYASRDKRIISIYQDNQGVSAARNRGLEIAKGKYIGFVDPDDWVSPYMYSTIIPSMENSNVDIGIVGYNSEQNTDSSIDYKPIYYNEKYINKFQIVSELFHVPISIGGYV